MPMPIRGKGAEAIRRKQQLKRLAKDLGIDGIRKLWGSYEVIIKKGFQNIDRGYLADYTLVLLDGQGPRATIGLHVLFDIAAETDLLFQK